jgi:hypothetical protein
MGRQYGPLQDEIIYDPATPSLLGVEVLDHPQRLRVTAQDDNSGVAYIQISAEASFAGASRYEAQGRVTEIPWTLPPGGVAYVRAADRAGNLSEVQRVQGATLTPGDIFLPLILRALRSD